VASVLCAASPQADAQTRKQTPRVPASTVTAPNVATVRTLNQALAITYATNPALQAARAALRAVDENVPQALAGWRPQVQIASTVG
jgi:outer membrane protein